jgi:hypothetical protein
VSYQAAPAGARAHLHSMPLGAPHGTHMYGAARHPAAVGCAQGARRAACLSAPSRNAAYGAPRTLATRGGARHHAVGCAHTPRRSRVGWRARARVEARREEAGREETLSGTTTARARTRLSCAARQRAARGVLNAARASAAASTGACVAAASCLLGRKLELRGKRTDRAAALSRAMAVAVSPPGAVDDALATAFDRDATAGPDKETPPLPLKDSDDDAAFGGLMPGSYLMHGGNDFSDTDTTPAAEQMVKRRGVKRKRESGRWGRKTTKLFPGGAAEVTKLWKAIKESQKNFPGGKKLPGVEVVRLMEHLTRALYDDSVDVEDRRRRAATIIAYLLGTRPVGGATGTTLFYHPQSTGSIVFVPAGPVEVEEIARAALAAIPTVGRMGRPSLEHFKNCHSPIRLTSCGIEKDCGDAFLATLDPKGLLPLRNAIVRFGAANEDWHVVVTPKEKVTARFTKTLAVDWNRDFFKLKRVEDPAGGWSLVTETGQCFKPRDTFVNSPVYTNFLQYYRFAGGWSDGAPPDALDGAIQLTRIMALITLEKLPEQKAAVVISGPVNSGKSSLHEIMTAPLGRFLAPIALRGTDQNHSVINFAVRHSMTTCKLVVLAEQGSFNVDVLREVLGNNLISVKNTASATAGIEAPVRATVLLEVNDAARVKLGSDDSGLAHKVFCVPLAALDAAHVPLGGKEALKSFAASHATEIFFLQLISLAAPEAGRAVADYWRHKAPLPDSKWRPPMLVEVSDKLETQTTEARMRAWLDANANRFCRGGTGDKLYPKDVLKESMIQVGGGSQALKKPYAALAEFLRKRMGSFEERRGTNKTVYYSGLRMKASEATLT